MKKRDLLNLLKDVKDDEEVLLWNGTVGDYQDIREVSTHYLYKRTMAHCYRMAKFEMIRDKAEAGQEPTLTKQEKIDAYNWSKGWKNEWEFPNSFFEDSTMKSVYGSNKKGIHLLSAKPRGKSDWGRACSIEY